MEKCKQWKYYNKTSFIGNELGTNRPTKLVLVSEKGKLRVIKMYLLVLQLEVARVLDKYVIPNPDLKGLYHLSADNIDKYSLYLCLIKFIRSFY